MKKLILAALLITVTSCSTLVPETKFVYPMPPADLMKPAISPVPMVGDKDGNIDPKTALGIIMQNNNIAKLNATQLDALEKWINETAKNIQKNN